MARRATQPVWPACWLDTPDRSAASPSREVPGIWEVCRGELAAFPPDLVQALRSAFEGLVWMSSGGSGVLVLNRAS